MLIVLKTIDFSSLITKYAVDDFNNKIYGRIAYKEPKLKLAPKNLYISFKNFLLLDQNSAVIFHANNLQVKWSLKNLFDPNQRIELFKADQLVLRASKAKDGKWNFEKLIKQPSANKLKFSFREIDAPNINLTIRDESTASEISYDKVKVFFKTIRRKQFYTIDIEANTQGQDSKALLDRSTTDLANSLGRNYISAKGNLNLQGDKNFLLNKNNFDLILVNLEAINIQLLNSILDFGLYNDNFQLLSKTLNDSRITLVSRISSEKGSKNNFEFDFLINNFLNFDNVSGDFLGNLNKDLIGINDLQLRLDQDLIKAKGNISKWQEKDPALNLKFNIVNLDLDKTKLEIDKVKLKAPAFIYDLLATVLESNNVAGDMEVKSTINSPEILLKLNSGSQSSKHKQIVADFKYISPNLLVKVLELPLKNSKLLMTGNFNTKHANYDLKATGKNADINSLKNIVIALPVSAQLQKSFQKFNLEGISDLNLHIHSSNKANDFHISGPINISKTNLSFIDNPVVFKNLNADLELNDSNAKVSSLTGYINNDYFETRGALNYRDLSQVNLELASPKLNITNLDSFSFLDDIKQKYSIQDATGTVKDIYLGYNKNQSNIDLTGHINLDTVEIRFGDLNKTAKIKGLIDLKNKMLKLTKLYWTFGNGSAAVIDGYANQDLTNPNFNIQAKDMPIRPLADLINTKENYKIEVTNGFVDSNFTVKDKDYLGYIDLKQVDFNLVGSRFATYPFKNLKGRINFDKSLQVSNLSGQYGNSYFRELQMKMDQYKSRDRTFAVNFNGDIYATELINFLPQAMQSLLVVKGYMPIAMSVTGNRQKQRYNIVSNLDKVEKFALSNWLEYQKNVPIALKAKFIVTPQLIMSEDCKIVVSNGKTPNSKKTRIKSTFQVEQWSTKKLNYFTSFVIANKIGNADLAYVEPQIITLKPLNLSAGKGSFACDTIGDLQSRQTICDIKISKAVAKKYGIGDLYANKIDVGLLSISNQPLEVDLNFANGNWNGIPYQDLDFDLKANGDYIYIDNLKAKVKDGTAIAKVSFNVITEESTFRIKGDKLPAHELVDGIWGFGSQVPEGLVSGVFEGKTKGILPEPMFFNLEGTTDLSVKNGKLSQLKSMQRILTAVNSIYTMDINNIFQILILYKGGLFNDLITSLKYDKGKISTQKLLLKAEEIELDVGGYLDYSTDQLLIEGQGLIPKRANSILKTIGVGDANLGNVLSLPSRINLSGSKKDKRFFEFKMTGPITDIDKSIASLRNSFKWIEK